MKILYLLQQFPKKTSETFILNEMIHLRSMGHDVRVVADWINKEASIDTHALIIEHDFMKKVVAANKYSRGWFKLVDFIKKFWFFSWRSPLKNFFYFKIAFFSKAARYGFNFWSSLDSYLLLVKFFNARFDIVYSPFAQIDKVKRGLIMAEAFRAPFLSAFRALELYSKKCQQQIINNRPLYDLVDSFITISQYNKNYLLSDLNFSEPIEVIHSSIDPDKFKRSAPLIPSAKLRLLTIARFVEKKGIIYLLDALAKLRSSGVDFEYLLIGDGPFRESYYQKIKDLKLESCVKITEPVNQEKIKNSLENCDIFILPCIIASSGDRDILANVLKEAMAMEVPVITSRISGIEELIDDKINGWLVPEKDSPALVNAIDYLSKNPSLRDKIGRAGREKIKGEFNVNYEASKLDEVFYRAIYQKKDLFSLASYFGREYDFFFSLKSKCNGMMGIKVYQEIYRYAKNAPAGDFLELGAHHGAATICLGRGIIDSSKDNRLFSIENGGEAGSSLCRYGDKEKNFNRLANNLKYFKTDQVTDIYFGKINDFFKSLPSEKKFSLVLIDADGALDRDFAALYNRLEPGSLVIIDDYENEIRHEKETFKNPLGKSYSTFVFTEYLLRKGMLVKEGLIDSTLFCRKPFGAASYSKVNDDELKKIRAEFMVFGIKNS